MTRERDIQHVLDHWFAERPTEVPDRVLDEVADRIGRQPQQPAWLTLWRDSHVNTYLKYAAAVAAVIVVAVAGLTIFGRPSGSNIGGGSATPSPTASPPALPEGSLKPGDYVARALSDDPMAFILTAPEGWRGFGGFFVGGPQESGAPSGIGIAFMHDPQVVEEPCNASGAPPSAAPSAPSVDDLVAALSAHGGVEVSGLTNASLGGYSGKRLDLQLPAELPCAQYYVFAEPQGLYANGPANRWRVWLLDVDGETAVVVLLDYAGTPAADRAAALAALDSLRITP